MTLIDLLTNHREAIIKEASEGLTRAPLKSYKRSTADDNTERITRLFDLTKECVSRKSLIPMMEYAKSVAIKRYKAGFDLQEVQAGFNVLEEVIWHTITDHLSPDEYPQAFGLTATVLGFGKETLATTYVSLLTHRKDVKSLDLSALFKGTW